MREYLRDGDGLDENGSSDDREKQMDFRYVQKVQLTAFTDELEREGREQKRNQDWVLGFELL